MRNIKGMASGAFGRSVGRGASTAMNVAMRRPTVLPFPSRG